MAVAITSISSSRSRRFEISLRISAESSTTSTLILRRSDSISALPCPLRALVSDGLSEQHLRVHDQHDAAVAKHRGAGHCVALNPLAVEGLDYQLLFTDERFSDDAVLPVAY